MNTDHVRYLTDHYDEKIRRVQEIDASFNFIFVTDIHNRLNEFNEAYNGHPLPPSETSLAVNTVDSMHYLLERCPQIGFVVCGGDIGNDYALDPQTIRESYREIMQALYRLPVPVHCCIGNHDDVTGEFRKGCFGNEDYGPSFVVLPHELHEMCMKYNPTEENYYYVDHEANGVGYRTVFLNTSDKVYVINPKTNHYPDHYEVSSRQALWLENEALKTDRNVIVFSHCPLNNTGIFGSGTHSVPIRPYDDVYNAPRAYYAAKSHENVVALIAGHVHFDNVNFDGDLPTVTTLCSLVQEWSPRCAKREFGQYSETAFDVYSIKDKMLYITRFGAGEDREIPLARMR